MTKNRCPKKALYADMWNEKVMYASRYQGLTSGNVT